MNIGLFPWVGRHFKKMIFQIVKSFSVLRGSNFAREGSFFDPSTRSVKVENLEKKFFEVLKGSTESQKSQKKFFWGSDLGGMNPKNAHFLCAVFACSRFFPLRVFSMWLRMKFPRKENRAIEVDPPRSVSGLCLRGSRAKSKKSEKVKKSQKKWKSRAKGLRGSLRGFGKSPKSPPKCITI